MYDILFMMGRDDVSVGVGGEGGITEHGTILPNVGGYLPIIEQGMTTAGYCRYRQAIPVGLGGRLDVDSNYGIRRSFLPQERRGCALILSVTYFISVQEDGHLEMNQMERLMVDCTKIQGNRRYSPLKQPTAQQVMIEKVSAGPITVIIIGAHTNFAIFLMSHPHLKKNINHIYVMGGGVRSKNPTGCCPAGSSSSCVPGQCGNPGNLFTDYTSNPYAEFNIFGDPFAAYQVFHSGIPVTLIPLDATNTIPITEQFFHVFEQSQSTYEAQYCFQSLKMARDTWFNDQFYSSYFMWDSFASGVAISIMQNGGNENEFAEMEYMNITVVTSNKPYGISDGSNPLFDELAVPTFNLTRGSVHSGHVQMGLRDPFCATLNGKGKCKDGYTAEVTGQDAVRVLVVTRAKPNLQPDSALNRNFFKTFLDVLNHPQQSARFNLTTQFPYYRQVSYKPDFRGKKLGKAVVFDMDMSAGDFLTLLYLLKVPVEEINLKAILVSPTGWANAATIDVIYDLLHMMGRDDIPVGLGRVFAMNQSDTIFSAVGDCNHAKAIPHGSGGFLDSDTLYGLARVLPRGPRRYTAENSVIYGAPEILITLNFDGPISKLTILTNWPLTNLADIIQLSKNTTSMIQDIFLGENLVRGLNLPTTHLHFRAHWSFQPSS